MKGCLIALGALLLAACGLEPRYALPPPERDDGTFRWIDASTSPPPDYLPVTFDDPGTGQRLEVCRNFIIAPPLRDYGYHLGELTVNDTGQRVCLAMHRRSGPDIRNRDNSHQQLWAQKGAPYRWLHLDDISERPLWLSVIWQNNRVPGDYVRNIYTEAPAEYWIPCAAQVEQRWRLGKLSLQSEQRVHCYAEVDGEQVAFEEGILVLYAPVAVEEEFLQR